MADDYEYENEGTKAFVNKLRYQGMKDSDIEASGIYKFKSDDDPNVNSGYDRAKKNNIESNRKLARR
jgi:hypothetical protein